MQNSISQSLDHSYIYSSRSVSLFVRVCVCLCYVMEINWASLRLQKDRSEGAVSGSYLFGQTLLVGPHSLIHAALFHSEGWKNAARRAWLQSVCYVLEWRGIFCLETKQTTRAGKAIQQTQSKAWQRKNYKKKVNVFYVKHGLMENQCTFLQEHRAGRYSEYSIGIWYRKRLCLCADIIKPRPTTCRLINSWRAVQHYWISSFVR